MDIKKKKQAGYWQYRYYIIAALCIAAIITYAVISLTGPKRARIDSKLTEIALVTEGDFIEYVDVEGIVRPFATVKINALESGFVERVVAEEGAILSEGDTILILKNPELLRTIADEEDEYGRQQRLLKEQDIEINKNNLTFRQQSLDVDFEINQIEDKLRIAREEYEMGMKSKAEFELAVREYEYHKNKAELQQRSLIYDSTTTELRRELLEGDLERVRTRRDRALARKENLVVRTPISGQLSFLAASVGEQVQLGSNLGEIKALNNFKIYAALSEYYVDRISSGLPGSISTQGEVFPLRVSRVVPEIKNRTFDVDLLFTDKKPESLRMGKSYRVQIELGQPEQAVIIPAGDFYNSTNGKWIYKVSDDGNRAIKTDIVIGRKNPEQYEVLAGLKPGDRVIINGYEFFDNEKEVIMK
ncbi:MAG: efflux RND transporter periplasmic adaptor subunit [Bacteroidales bacterium]|nr:efflux RND transporter periplasmic adaptor subunit [Bacteroidales bacterium]